MQQSITITLQVVYNQLQFFIEIIPISAKKSIFFSEEMHSDSFSIIYQFLTVMVYSTFLNKPTSKQFRLFSDESYSNLGNNEWLFLSSKRCRSLWEEDFWTRFWCVRVFQFRERMYVWKDLGAINVGRLQLGNWKKNQAYETVI